MIFQGGGPDPCPPLGPRMPKAVKKSEHTEQWKQKDRKTCWSFLDLRRQPDRSTYMWAMIVGIHQSRSDSGASSGIPGITLILVALLSKKNGRLFFGAIWINQTYLDDSTNLYMSRVLRFPTMWYVRPAKPQISLRISAVWSEPLLVALIFHECQATDWTSFGVSKLKRRLHRLVWVYTCQNATLFEITCGDSYTNEDDVSSIPEPVWEPYPK